MGESGMRGKSSIFFSCDPDEFLEDLRKILREEIRLALTVFHSKGDNSVHPSPGNELIKVRELCQFLKVSKPTIYDWIRCGKLRPIKIQSRTYFLRKEIDELFKL
jgi:excisionase family DNA binding protein